MTVGLFGDSKLSKLAATALAKHGMHRTVNFFTQTFTEDENKVLNLTNLNKHEVLSFFICSIGYKTLHMKETVAAWLMGSTEILFQELLDSDAYIPHVNLFNKGIGNWVMEKATIQAHTSMGDFNTFWPGSILSHDSSVGDYNWISPGAIICGEVEIGSHNFIGAGAIITPGTVIGDGQFIKAGQVISNKTIDSAPQEIYTNNLIDKSSKDFWEKK